MYGRAWSSTQSSTAEPRTWRCGFHRQLRLPGFFGGHVPRRQSWRATDFENRHRKHSFNEVVPQDASIKMGLKFKTQTSWRTVTRFRRNINKVSMFVFSVWRKIGATYILVSLIEMPFKYVNQRGKALNVWSTMLWTSLNETCKEAKIEFNQTRKLNDFTFKFMHPEPLC